MKGAVTLRGDAGTNALHHEAQEEGTDCEGLPFYKKTIGYGLPDFAEELNYGVDLSTI